MTKLSNLLIVSILFFVSLSHTNYASLIGKTFLKQEGETLAGKPLQFPDSFKLHSITLIAFGFSRKAGDDFDSWLIPFRNRYNTNDGVNFISIPMIGKIPKWIVKQMKKGMKKGIDESLHSHQMIYTGNTKVYKEYYRLENKKMGYFFLVDSNGVILWEASGKASNEQLAMLYKVADKQLLESN